MWKSTVGLDPPSTFLSLNTSLRSTNVSADLRRQSLTWMDTGGSIRRTRYRSGNYGETSWTEGPYQSEERMSRTSTRVGRTDLRHAKEQATRHRTTRAVQTTELKSCLVHVFLDDLLRDSRGRSLRPGMHPHTCMSGGRNEKITTYCLEVFESSNFVVIKRRNPLAHVVFT